MVEGQACGSTKILHRRGLPVSVEPFHFNLMSTSRLSSFQDIPRAINNQVTPGRSKYKNDKRKDTEVSLEPVCGLWVCNEVWWRPCPTNLPPPSQIAPFITRKTCSG